MTTKRPAAGGPALRNSSHHPSPMNSVPHKGLWFLSGAIGGAWLSLWFWSGYTAFEMDKWQCQRYSPIDGQCSLYVRREQP